ncbi:ArsR/SmtB family transcription factor [Desulforhabdus amnigena]|uniref:HTH arsR-type domain-containing protein n=1 Tax=Desulforhabdus amnigena TaxID=40218 RepID=A0A9W6D3B3_9BACT|nr:metalloregulator ArsR/SmtB family transcription factor [Desulforhabdus amnigena]NLJ27063.1 winged helix-turn-helix transcriptional regulator [Deltaproteobacteria bacterium]GLI34134.1 hypothetical protein DAMNIGENAA_15670 [Desulforhabdus amnigena]
MSENSLTVLETEQLQRAADILKTVAHPTRLQIIDLLEQGERTVSELCQSLGTQQPYTSQQLNLMKSKGILSSRREGNQVYYAIANYSVVKVIRCVRQQVGGAEKGAEECVKEFNSKPSS